MSSIERGSTVLAHSYIVLLLLLLYILCLFYSIVIRRLYRATPQTQLIFFAYLLLVHVTLLFLVLT